MLFKLLSQLELRLDTLALLGLKALITRPCCLRQFSALLLSLSGALVRFVQELADPLLRFLIELLRSEDRLRTIKCPLKLTDRSAQLTV